MGVVWQERLRVKRLRGWWWWGRWWGSCGGGKLCWDRQKVRCGRLNQHHLEDVWINRLEKHWVFQYLSEESSINLRRSLVNSVLGNLDLLLICWGLILAVEVPVPRAPLALTVQPRKQEEEGAQQQLAGGHPTAAGIESWPPGQRSTRLAGEREAALGVCRRNWPDCCHTEVAANWLATLSSFVSWENRAER